MSDNFISKLAGAFTHELPLGPLRHWSVADQRRYYQRFRSFVSRTRGYSVQDLFVYLMCRTGLLHNAPIRDDVAHVTLYGNANIGIALLFDMSCVTMDSSDKTTLCQPGRLSGGLTSRLW